MKKFIIVFIVIVLLGLGFYFINKSLSNNSASVDNSTATTTPVDMATTTANSAEVSIGKSVQGRDIAAYNFGTGTKDILFVGGIHGGYEWNTALVAFQLVDYLKANPQNIPSNLKVTVIPVLNPDGLFKTVGTAGRFDASSVPSDQTLQVAGRFNGNGVDLNRNFDCDWQTNATWQNKTVSGGDSVFSEPESQAMKSYIEQNKPAAVVVWYSSAGGVYASSCHNGVSPETNKLTSTFANASGYKAYQSFDFYETTGDMVNWLAKENIPAISVLLTNHTDTEWTKNQKGIDAVLNYYAQ